jgi:plasmid stability protein
MAAITIRDVPDETRRELAARAGRAGQSMQEYLRLAVVQLAASPDPAEVVERARARAKRLELSFPAEDIRTAISADRR